MKDTLKDLLKLDKLFKNIEGLIEVRIARFRLELEQEIAYRMKRVVLWGMVSLLVALTGLFFSVAAALWIGH